MNHKVITSWSKQTVVYSFILGVVAVWPHIALLKALFVMGWVRATGKELLPPTSVILDVPVLWSIVFIKIISVGHI